ncbi:MAG TPA: Crp/Fnr family transcriptional regulator [Candidatus Acidoferrales bacterium]|jgi:CRP/FNR family cyclic AMP-dependent transcriptional regulator|nr:Crp/Fnr family transcriptional regulator [Candidatus Acidoferrales bacterium]
MRAEDVLAGTYLFRDLPPERLAAYAAHTRRRRYPRGTYLSRVGDPAQDIFILASGTVKASRVGTDGDEVVDMMVWRPGEVFGEPGAVIEGATRVIDGLAVEDSECLLLHRDELMRILEEDPVVMRRILARLAEMTRDRFGVVSGVAFLDVAGRVAAKLLELAARHGEACEGGVRIDLKMSQRTLAGMVLASRESVNRALATLISEGAVAQESGTIVIQRIDSLRRRAEEFDAAP